MQDRYVIPLRVRAAILGGEWALLVAFSGHGFKEDTAKSRRPPRF
jgi:hypothetical protein